MCDYVHHVNVHKNQMTPSKIGLGVHVHAIACTSCMHDYVYIMPQALCLAVGRGILYSAGSDLSLRSWHIDSLEEIGVVKVQCMAVAYSTTSTCPMHVHVQMYSGKI